ncbi:MAG: serine protease [Clostridia bacterium]|nr:serine protease [Clostridia bacterium]
MKYFEETHKSDKIPYDSRPIIRQPATNTSRHRMDKPAKAGFGLYLIVFILVGITVVLSALVFTLLRKNTKSADNTIINIQTSGEIDVSAVVSKCRSSVVRVHAGLPTPSTTSVDYATFAKLTSKGSGVIFQDNKDAGICYIVTCYHVIKGHDSQIYVILNDSFNPLKVELVSFSSVYDIAVIKLDNDLYSESSAGPADVADSAFVLEGDKCVAYGNPQGTGFSATSGDISKTVDLVTVGGVVNRVIRTSAAINGGNSGGGLFDAWGKLIGIVNAKTGDNPSYNTYIDNIAFAIPSDVAIALAKNIVRNNNPKKPVLGMKLGIANKNESYDIVNGRQITKQTIIVTEVNEGSPFKVNDEIKSFVYNGNIVNVRNLYSVDDHMFNFLVGDVVTFEVLRNGTLISVDLTISKTVSADDTQWYN